MKLSDKRSDNVEDRSRDTSVFAPHSNPNGNARLVHLRDVALKEASARDLKRAEDLGKDNPMAEMLGGMDREYRKARQHPSRKKSVPVPTERPDPSEPYTRPTLWNDDDKTKGLMDGMRPSDQSEPKTKGGMKPKPDA